MCIRDDSKKIIRHYLAKAIECGTLDELFPLQYDELAQALCFNNTNYCRVCCQYLKGMGYIIISTSRKDECLKISLRAPAIDFLETP